MRSIKPVSIINIIVLCALLSFGAQANALLITPTTSPQWTGLQTGQAQIDAAIAVFLGTSVELYKDNVGGIEEGPLAGSYNTEYFNSPSEPSGATITYTGGAIVGPNAFLLVKDGNQNPAWYLFGLSDPSLAWNGTETLILSGFWPDQGAISHVTLYGGPGSTEPVPEPATLFLLGSGLVGLAGAARRKFKK